MSRFDVDPMDAAVYDAVHDYRDRTTGSRGAAAVARRINMNGTTLRHKANPDDPAQPTFKEVAAICLATENFAPLYAFNAACNHAAYPLPDHAGVDDEEILESVLKFSEEGGQAMAAIRMALADGRIMAGEYVECADELEDVMRACATLKDRLLDRVVDKEHLPESVTGVTPLRA